MMTDEWKTKEFKERVSGELQAVNLQPLHLSVIDKRLQGYVCGVIGDPDAHNLFELLAVAKFLRLMNEYEFRTKRIKKFVRLYESLKFSGLKGRQQYKLTPVQYFQFASMLGFYKPDGTRLVRNAILFVPRKFSKTTSTASLAVNELLFGDANAQIFCAANAYSQAQICFKEITKITKQLDPKKVYFKATRETLRWLDNPFGKESYVECLTGGSETKDGLAASLVIYDEYAAARYVKGHSDGAELLQVLRSSMGTRREPMTVIITTASRVSDGPFETELEQAKQILLSEASVDGVRDDSEFASLFMPDFWEMDEEHMGMESVWKKCNPHIGITVQDNFYPDMWTKAKRDPETMLEFKTKMLNVFVNASVQEWMPSKVIEELQTDFSVDMETGERECMVGIDLSVKDDFSVVVWNVYNEDERRFYVDMDCYIPEGTLESHPNSRLYKKWVEQGWMKVCEGDIISGEMIVNDILKRVEENVRVLQIGYDSYKSDEIVNSLRAAISYYCKPDKILKAVPQSYGQFTSPVETFEMAVYDRPSRVRFSRNPIFPYCFGNAYLDTDKMDNKKPVKTKANLKIDAVIGTLETFWLWNNYEG